MIIPEGQYTFNKTAKTITFTGFTNIDLNRVRLINNITVGGTTIYQFNKTGYTGSVSTNVLTLVYDTSAMNNTDKLAITYDNDRTTFDEYNNLSVTLGTELSYEDSITGGARIQPLFKELSGLSTAATASNNILLPSTDVSFYSWISVAITNSGWTGTIIAQFSNNGSEWYQSQWFNGFNYQSAQTITIGGIYQWPRFGRYFRVLTSSVGTGTVSATAELYSLPLSYWANGISAFQSGNYNTRGGGTTSTQVTAGLATDTTIKSSAGYLDKILVTTVGTNAMTIYDNTSSSGKILAIVPANTTAGTIISVGLTATSGITIAGNGNNPAVTIGFN